MTGLLSSQEEQGGRESEEIGTQNPCSLRYHRCSRQKETQPGYPSPLRSLELAPNRPQVRRKYNQSVSKSQDSGQQDTAIQRFY